MRVEEMKKLGGKDVVREGYGRKRRERREEES